MQNSSLQCELYTHIKNLKFEKKFHFQREKCSVPIKVRSCLGDFTLVTVIWVKCSKIERPQIGYIMLKCVFTRIVPIKGRSILDHFKLS
jgi:hypothetical protein